MRFMASTSHSIRLQALGWDERGNRSVDCWPGTAVLVTCSSRSSADANVGSVILEVVDRSRLEHVDSSLFTRFREQLLMYCEC